MKAATQLRRSRAYIVFLLALALGACAPLAQVREVNPRLGAQRGSPPELQRAEHAIAEGQKLQRIDPHRAIGFYLGGLEAAGVEYDGVARDNLFNNTPCLFDPGSRRCRNPYRFARDGHGGDLRNRTFEEAPPQPQMPPPPGPVFGAAVTYHDDVARVAGSICVTRPGTPSLSRLKSMMR